MKAKFIELFIIFLCIFYILPGNSYAQKNQYVVLIGWDGVSSDGFQFSQTPNINKLIQEGAISVTTRSVLPAQSAPNWAANLSGAGPEQTGVTNNNWRMLTGKLEPTVKDATGHFPSIFNLIRNGIPEAKMGMFYDWDWLSEYINTNMVDKAVLTSSFTETTEKAIEFIAQSKPLFTFVYYGTPDNVAQQSGYQTIEYFLSINKIDAEIGKLVMALKGIGIYEQTNIIIVSDHGGLSKGIGNETLQEIEIPWIISGPGIIKNRALQNTNTVINTAPTIAYILGLTQPDYWTGKPMKEAFEKDNKDSRGWTYIPKPQSSMKSAVYFNETEIKFSAPWDNVIIRYTLDGTDPNDKSPQYTKSFIVKTSTTVKAACFLDSNRSEIVEGKIIIIEGVERFKLLDLPDKKYSGNGDLTLLDFERGSTNYQDGKWFGFEGYNMTAIFRFTERKKVASVTIGCLQDVVNLIYFPAGFEFYISDDGEEYKFIGGITRADIKGKNLDAKDFVKTFDETFAPTYYFKVVVKNIGIAPAGAPGAGKKAWLFVDEIIIK